MNSSIKPQSLHAVYWGGQEFSINVSVTASTQVANEVIDWQFIPIDQYDVPSLPVKGSAAQAWSRFVNSMRASEATSQPFRREDDLRSLSEEKLTQLYQPIPWADMAEAFVEQTQLLSKKAGVTALVLPPHAGLSQLIEAIAHTSGWKVLSAPAVDDLLNGAPKWLKANERHFTGSRPWIIPDLSRLYIRHVNGLSLVRDLYTKISNGAVTTGLMGCDSWAWKYLERVCGPFPVKVLTRQQAPAAELQQAFHVLLNTSKARPWQIKDSSSGDLLVDQAGNSKSATASVFVELAAASRGCLPLALHYWLARLRDEPESEADDSKDAAANADQSKPVHNPSNCVWVGVATPEPKWPTGNHEQYLLLLHSLLVHNGQSTDRLQLTLESLTGQIDGLLARLYAAGFVDTAQGCWRVTPMAYPAVRRALQSRAFLVDSF